MIIIIELLFSYVHLKDYLTSTSIEKEQLRFRLGLSILKPIYIQKLTSEIINKYFFFLFKNNYFIFLLMLQDKMKEIRFNKLKYDATFSIAN